MKKDYKIYYFTPGDNRVHSMTIDGPNVGEVTKQTGGRVSVVELNGGDGFNDMYCDKKHNGYSNEIDALLALKREIKYNQKERLQRETRELDAIERQIVEIISKSKKK